MASIVWMLWLGVLLGSCSAGSRCPSPCSCPPATLTCQGCPKDYLVLANDTQLLSVNGCKDIEYLLKLHSSHLENERTRYSLHKLEITDSSMDKIPESYISNEYPIQSLNFSNNLIESIEPGLEANNLTHLDLSRNRLRFIANRTFCRMKNMLYLDVSSNLISNLSVDSFAGLDKLAHLDLSNNNLTYLMDALFVPVASLQQLNLSYNMLEILSEKCFGNLLLLQQLDISYNRLTTVAPGTLQFLPNLAKLLLADNPQLKPDAQIFVGTGRRLQQVDASRTGLRRVPEALTHSVRYLSLAGNRISTLRCGDLDGYPLLHMLDISDNIIEYVEDDALGRLEMISRLYLDKNRLKTIPKMLPDKLAHLSLDNNIIQNLTIMDFTELINLKELILSNNFISYIQENAFSPLTALEILDISNNPLKSLTPNTFGGPLFLKVLKICNVSASPPARDISFPVPFPERIEQLHLTHSPGLTREFLADTAALAAMTRLQYIDMSFTNTSNIRSDLLHFLPQLKHLKLEGNSINCSELNWLAEWMRENVEEYKDIVCGTPKILIGIKILDLPPPTKSTQATYISQKIEKQKGIVDNSWDPVFIQNTDKTLQDIFFVSKQNVSNVDTLKKFSLPNVTNNAKSLLDLQSYEQYRMNFKFPRKADTKTNFEEEDKLYHNEGVNNTKKLIKHETSVLDVTEVKNKNEMKKFNDSLFMKTTSVKTPNNRNKLIELFSQLSQIKEYKSFNVTNKMKKNNLTTDVSVPLCNANGNLNGTENKTKCSQLPEKVQQQSQTRENINIKQQRNVYRKNVNVKLTNNTKLKNWKYVSIPKEYTNKLNSVRKFGEENSTNNIITDIASRESIVSTEDKQNTEVFDSSKTKNETFLEWKYRVWNITQPNNQLHSPLKDDLLPESIENVSQHQTLEFKAEESIAVSYVGTAVIAATFVGTGMILTIIFLSRKRLRSARQRGPEIMEVQTISTVGELW